MGDTLVKFFENRDECNGESTILVTLTFPSEDFDKNESFDTAEFLVEDGPTQSAEGMAALFNACRAKIEALHPHTVGLPGCISVESMNFLINIDR